MHILMFGTNTDGPQPASGNGMRSIVITVFFTLSLFAQSDKPYTFSGGFKLGAPINNPSFLSPFINYSSSRWTGGPTVEFHLPYSFSIELDALYRNNRTNYSTTFRLGSNVNAYNITSFQQKNVWDLPLLMKRRFQVGPARPFVSAGWFLSRESTKSSAFYQCSGPQGSCRPADYPAGEPTGGQTRNLSFLHGPAAGAGLEFKTRYVTITPELRFNRAINSYPRDNRFTGMVGFTFGKK